MSTTDSDLNLSDSDDEYMYSQNFSDDVRFYLICQEPELFKLTRTFSG